MSANESHVNVEYGDGEVHDIEPHPKPVEPTLEEKRARVIATCVQCKAAKEAGYETCTGHRPVESLLPGQYAQSWITQDGAAHDVEQTVAKNALRTWRPQVVHYHKQGDPCNGNCHQVFPNDLPRWGGSNPE